MSPVEGRRTPVDDVSAPSSEGSLFMAGERNVPETESIDSLRQRVDELEAELRKRDTRRASVRTDRARARSDIEERLEELEGRLRDLRARRAKLLEEIRDERDHLAADETLSRDRLDDLNSELRRVDREHRQARAEYGEWLRELEIEDARAAGAPRRQSRRTRRAAAAAAPPSPTYDYAEPYPAAAVPRGYGDAFSRSLSEGTRLGSAVLLAHVDALGAAADAFSAFTDEIYNRNAARRSYGGYLAVPDVYNDVAAGVMRAIDATATAPARAAETIYDSFR
jgi:hypothetical protein